MAGDAFYRGAGDATIRGTGDSRAPGGGVLAWYDCSDTASVTKVSTKIQGINDLTTYANHLDDTNEAWPDFISKGVEGGGFVDVPDFTPNSDYDYQEIRDDTYEPPEYDGDAELWLVAKIDDTGDDQTWFYYWGCPQIRTRRSTGTFQTLTLFPGVTAGGQLYYTIQISGFTTGNTTWKTGNIVAAGSWHILRITCSESDGWKLYYNDGEHGLSWLTGYGDNVNYGVQPWKDADPAQASDYIRFMSNAEPAFHNAFQVAEFKALEGIMSTAAATAFYNSLVAKWDL